MSQTKYIKAEWLSPHTRATSSPSDSMTEEKTQPLIETGEFELIPVGMNSAGETELDESVFELLESSGEEKNAIVEKEWKPPELKPKRSQTGVKMVTGGGEEDGQHNSMMKTEENSEHTPEKYNQR
ncbi:uncharacterized protein LOC110767451 isoform X2 [Prunus avium]|uniref:Uncharacterized protein LOC110767451 isoform X2 n=1 Tax=Prunus avium TaxID=42229 RepID=A0A6P5THV6_PRUAV|nr:uncharacterized protein LOC110767451 isoform X2 [Prunus avium]